MTTSRDMTARLFTLHPLEGFKPKTFGGHRDKVLRAFFSEDEKTVSLASLKERPLMIHLDLHCVP